MSVDGEGMVTAGEVLRLLLEAARIRHHGQPLDLPPLARRGPRPASLAAFRRALVLARVFTSWRPRACFYRSFVAAVIGRRLGLDVQIHFGLRETGADRRRAHCWVTLRGCALGETHRPQLMYPTVLGNNGPVQYWLAQDPKIVVPQPVFKANDTD